MLEFIGLMTVIYLLLMGLARLFGGKQPQREIYIIREYEIGEEMDEQQQPKQLLEEQGSPPQQGVLPDNVVAIDRKK